MASLTASYLLFHKLAKENNWPMDDEKFCVAATVGFFAPYVFRFKAGDKDVGNIDAWGRRAAFFSGASMVYPTIEDLKNHNYDEQSLCIQRRNVSKRFKIVDPVADLSSFFRINNGLLDKDSSNIAFYLGILSALFIAEKWDKFVQRDEYRPDNGGRIKFNGNIATIPSGVASMSKMMRGTNLDKYKKEDGSIRINHPRSMLYKVYPRFDKQVIDMIGVDQSFFDSVTSMIQDYYSKEELSDSVSPYWRIPTQKQLEPKKSKRKPSKSEISNEDYMEHCLEIVFPESIRSYFIDEIIEEFPRYKYFKPWIDKYNAVRDEEKTKQMITPSDIGKRVLNIETPASADRAIEDASLGEQ